MSYLPRFDLPETRSVTVRPGWVTLARPDWRDRSCYYPDTPREFEFRYP